MLVLDDPRAFGLYEAAIQFMGGSNADMPSHIGVSIHTMRGAWRLKLPAWQRGRAVGRLLERLVQSRPNDWKAVLHVLDAELAKLVHAGDPLAGYARDYLAEWVIGHFYDLDQIRSADRIKAQFASRRTLKMTRKSGQKKIGRRRAEH